MTHAIVKDNELEDLVAHVDNMVDASSPMLSSITETKISDFLEAILNIKFSQLAIGISPEISEMRTGIDATEHSLIPYITPLIVIVY